VSLHVGLQVLVGRDGYLDQPVVYVVSYSPALLFPSLQ